MSAEDVQRNYDDNQQQYRTPEQVRASHILLKTEGKDDAAVKKQAEEILAKVKAPGADFAKLANQYTEEEAGKTRGGDLDFFARRADGGQMVKEFEDAAFALKPGRRERRRQVTVRVSHHQGHRSQASRDTFARSR